MLRLLTGKTAIAYAIAKELDNEVRGDVDEVVRKRVEGGTAEIIPGSIIYR